MQKKKFIFDLAILLVLNLLIKPFWTLIVEPKVQGQIGDISYGEYFVIFNFSLLLNILLDFGLSNFNNKNIAQNSHLLSKHFSKMLGLKFALGLFYIIISLFVGFILLGFNLKLVAILCVNSFFLSFILFLRSNLQALHMFRVDSIISVLDRIIMIAIVGLMLLHVFGVQIDAMKFVYAQTLGYALTAIISFVVVLNKTHTFKLNWDWAFNRFILKKSAPYAILVLLMTFYNRLDSVMIEKLLPGDFGKEQSGIYAKSFRLLDAANQIAYLFSIQLFPLFSRMLKQKENIENIVKLGFTLLITPALIVSVSTIFYAENFFDKIYTGDTQGYEILALIMNCFTAISITYIFGTLLTANGNLKHLNYMALTGIAINIILNFILIPKYFALGSAISSLVTQFLTGFIQIYISYKVFKFKVNTRLMFSLFMFVMGLFIVNYFTLHLTKQWMLNFIIMLIFSGLLAFVTGMINPKSVLRFIKYK
ncbi:MAG: polysaccharide biosynthesis C-terminal domain-containing protein [Bacteroidetes bacterium]|nr:polysaccharide biosynthesis C-terminal domain-containing protein [Bacteroidota bacterium]